MRKNVPNTCTLREIMHISTLIINKHYECVFREIKQEAKQKKERNERNKQMKKKETKKEK